MNKRIIALQRFVGIRCARPQLLYDANIAAVTDMCAFTRRNWDAYFTGLDPTQFFVDITSQLERRSYNETTISSVLEMVSAMHTGYELPSLNL